MQHCDCLAFGVNKAVGEEKGWRKDGARQKEGAEEECEDDVHVHVDVAVDDDDDDLSLARAGLPDELDCQEKKWIANHIQEKK